MYCSYWHPMGGYHMVPPNSNGNGQRDQTPNVGSAETQRGAFQQNAGQQNGGVTGGFLQHPSAIFAQALPQVNIGMNAHIPAFTNGLFFPELVNPFAPIHSGIATDQFDPGRNQGVPSNSNGTFVPEPMDTSDVQGNMVVKLTNIAPGCVLAQYQRRGSNGLNPQASPVFPTIFDNVGTSSGQENKVEKTAPKGPAQFETRKNEGGNEQGPPIFNKPNGPAPVSVSQNQGNKGVQTGSRRTARFIRRGNVHTQLPQNSRRSFTTGYTGTSRGQENKALKTPQKRSVEDDEEDDEDDSTETPYNPQKILRLPSEEEDVDALVPDEDKPNILKTVH